MRSIKNILNLGIKELRSLLRDPAMLVLIAFAFTASVYSSAVGQPEALQNAAIAIVDEDQSQLSDRISGDFFLPFFLPPASIGLNEMDKVLDDGTYTFVLNIPPNFQRDVLAGRQPAIQLNVDATRMSQAFLGNGYIQQIVSSEAADFVRHAREKTVMPVELETRMLFNPSLTPSWFGAVNALINNITMLSIILTGAALIREREHGTIEHLLVMPLTPLEIMLGKVWSMAAVVLAASLVCILVVIRGFLHVPLVGSLPLFMLGATLNLFATTSMGIFIGTIARSMPQMGLLMMLILLPLQMLSGGMTPRESMPDIVQNLMLVAPTTHFVSLSQAILFRGAGFGIVWPQFLALLGIGIAFFFYALSRFRKSINSMA